MEHKVISSENRIQKLEAELARKAFIEDKKEKHSQRMFRVNESLKQTVGELLTQLASKFEKVVTNQIISELIAKLKKMLQGIEAGAATAIDDVKPTVKTSFV